MTTATAELKTEPELKQLSRRALNDYAQEHDVDPAAYSNKETLLEAVPKADTPASTEDASDASRVGGGAGASGDRAPNPNVGTDTSPVAGATSTDAEQADAASPSPKTVEQQRDEQLKAGKVTGAAKKAADAFKDATPAEHRAGRLGAKPLDGRVDNMTRRSDADVQDGHFCRIDYSKLGKEEIASVESIVGEGNTGVGKADYGVYLQPGALDEQGYPLTAVVLLRDEHSAQIVVPYAALVNAQAGGR